MLDCLSDITYQLEYLKYFMHKTALKMIVENLIIFEELDENREVNTQNV